MEHGIFCQHILKLAVKVDYFYVHQHQAMALDTDINTLHFAFQAKDAASLCQGTQDNVTEIGRYIQIAGPRDFIAFYDEE
jgi:hypothetical protein